MDISRGTQLALLIRLSLIAFVVFGVVRAQFSDPPKYVTVKPVLGDDLPPGEIAFTGERGWPFAVRGERLGWIEAVVEHSGLKLAFDIAACAIIMISTAVVLFRLRPAFTLSTLIQIVTGVGLTLAIRPLVPIPSHCLTSSAITLGIFCASLVLTHGLLQIVAATIRSLRIAQTTHARQERS